MSIYGAQTDQSGPRTSLLEGKIVTAEHDRFDEARAAWNLTVDQQPAAVVFPESAEDVAAAVRFAREHGLRVAAQGTGHNAGVLGSLKDTILLKTERMRGVEIDALPADALNAFIEVAGAFADFPLLTVELRHLDGALRRSHPEHGALRTT